MRLTILTLPFGLVDWPIREVTSGQVEIHSSYDATSIPVRMSNNQISKTLFAKDAEHDKSWRVKFEAEELGGRRAIGSEFAVTIAEGRHLQDVLCHILGHVLE